MPYLPTFGCTLLTQMLRFAGLNSGDLLLDTYYRLSW